MIYFGVEDFKDGDIKDINTKLAMQIGFASGNAYSFSKRTKTIILVLALFPSLIN